MAEAVRGSRGRPPGEWTRSGGQERGAGVPGSGEGVSGGMGTRGGGSGSPGSGDGTAKGQGELGPAGMEAGQREPAGHWELDRPGRRGMATGLLPELGSAGAARWKDQWPVAGSRAAGARRRQREPARLRLGAETRWHVRHYSLPGQQAIDKLINPAGSRRYDSLGVWRAVNMALPLLSSFMAGLFCHGWRGAGAHWQRNWTGLSVKNKTLFTESKGSNKQQSPIRGRQRIGGQGQNRQVRNTHS